MHFSIKTLLLTFGIFFTIIGFSQSHQLPKTLLWKISGNGLNKPSYLFGTIHLTDERLFNFEDSVYHAIEASEGLAIEINPDEMIAEMINKSIDDKYKGKKIKEILDGDEYRHYTTLIKKKFGKPADEVTTQDIIQEKNKWMTEYLKKGEMPTFVDAYLYSIAKKQGKWLGGIEDIADQADLNDILLDKSDIAYVLADNNPAAHSYFSKENEKYLDKMIWLYNNQDIEGIEQFSDFGITKQKKDLLLINRNIKMARRMDSLAHIRTMFLAVGTAHLPGDSGVIALLRQRGFTVEPVYGSQKIAAKKYKFKEIQIPWTEVRDDKKQYTILMPGPPTTITPLGLLEMKFYFDISDFTGFYAMAFNGPQKMDDTDSTYYALANKILGIQKKRACKHINAGNINGREFYSDLRGYPTRLRLYLQGHSVYVLMSCSLKENRQQDSTAQQFFNSFHPTIHDSIVGYNEPLRFRDSMMGIEFTSPVELSYNKNMSDTNTNNWKISTWSGIDPNTGSLVMLVDKEVRPGIQLVNDNAVYDDYKTFLQKQYQEPVMVETSIQGKKAYIASGHSRTENYYMHSLATIQEGKAILLFILGDSALIAHPAFTNTIQSFRFLTRPKTEWSYQSYPSENFNVWSPGKILKYGKEPRDMQFISFDTTTATTYSIIVDTLNRFVWGTSDTAFLRNYLQHEFDDDSILTSCNMQQGTIGGISYLVRPNGCSDIYKRVSYWLNGHQIFKLLAYGSKELVNNENSDRFFAGFKVRNFASDLLSSTKQETLFQCLSSVDSIQRNEAYQAISKIPFTHDDLPRLHIALFKKYPSLNQEYHENFINWAISQKISDMGDSNSINFIKGKYRTILQNDTVGREIAIVTLAQMQTEESFEAMLSLLEWGPLLTNPEYRLQYALKDSLPLTAKIFSRLLPLSQNPVMVPLLADLSVRLIDSGLIKMNQVLPFKPLFTSEAKKFGANLSKLKNNNIEYNWYQMVDLLGRWNTPQDITELELYLTTSDLYFRNYVAKRILESKHSVPSTIIRDLAQNIASRKGLYNNLMELKKMELFPKEYLSQQLLAQSELYQVANEDNDEDSSDPPKITFIQKRTAIYNDKKYSFYLFRVRFKHEGENATYLGIAGGYPSNNTKVNPDILLTNVYWQEQLNSANITELFEAYIAGLNEPNEK